MKKIGLSLLLLSASLFASGEFEEVAGALGGMLMVVLIALWTVQILFILSITKTIKAVRTEHSTSSEILAWLILVPIVGWIFAIITVVKLAGDYKLFVQKYEIKELYARDGGQTKGLIAFVGAFFSIIPFIGFLAGIVAFIAWIMYWVELGNMRASIAMYRSEELAEPAVAVAS